MANLGNFIKHVGRNMEQQQKVEYLYLIPMLNTLEKFKDIYIKECGKSVYDLHKEFLIYLMKKNGDKISTIKYEQENKILIDNVRELEKVLDNH